MSKSFVQVPPQSTGKKLVTEFRKEIHFDNLVGSFEVGDTVTGATSGATGVTTAVITEGFAVNSGELYLKNFSGTFVDNEDLQVSGITQASYTAVGGQVEYDLQKFVLTDPNNLENNQRIDRFGATVNTFTDGSPVFGPFGTLTVGEPQTIKSYSFLYGPDNSSYTDVAVGSGSLTYNNTRASMVLSCSTGATDAVSRTSDYYHPYDPGVGTLIEFTTQIGDAGKANVVRRWGYYDDNNGFFWELNGTTLYVVMRSSSTGSVIDTKIAQEDFNYDKLDGAGTIGFDLDVTKGNIYFIDFQWLGAGRVKFGVIESEGSRLTAHVIRNANTNSTYPYTRTASLPLRIEQFNTGVAISTSEMNWACAVVKHTSSVIPSGVPLSYDSKPRAIVPADGEVPVISIRPKQYLDSAENHSIIKGISTIIASNCQGFTRFKYYVGLNPALSGGTWGDVEATSLAEIDSSNSSTFVPAFASHKLTSLVAPNKSEIIRDMSPRESRTFELYNKANLTQQIFVVTAEALTDSATIFAAINWEEYRK